MRILIAEDDAVSRFLLKKYLTDLGNDVITTKNGIEAWDVLSTDKTVQLAILDWIMPGLNGIEVCRKVRAEKQTPYVYIIFLTAKDNLDEVIEGLNAGADDYIKKPFDRNEFQLRLNAGERVIRLQAELLELLSRARKAEDSLRQAMDRLQAVIDAVPGYVSWISSDLKYLGANKNLAETYKMSPAQFPGKQVGFINPGTRFVDFVENFFQSENDGDRIELKTQGTEQTRYHLLVAQKYWNKTAGVFIGVDITDRKVAEKALQKARRNEVAVASRIQSTLLFGRPPGDTRNLDIKAMSIPSQEVDGDFFDFLSPGEACVDMMIGDVMGKGIPAALVGAATKHQLLRGLNADPAGIASPENIVDYAHKMVTPQLLEIESFVTICYARFNENTRELTFVDCGHTKTIHYCADQGKSQFLEGFNAPIGFLENEPHQQVTVNYGIGDVFLFYSDGITETMNPAGELYGEERLVEFVNRHHEYPSGTIGKKLLEEVQDFRGMTKASDDLTLVICRVKDEKQVPELFSCRQEFTCDLKELENVRTFYRRFFENPQMTDAGLLVRDTLEIAMNEAVSNVIRHGKARGTLEFEMKFMEDGWLSIMIRHNGKRFEPGLIKPVDAAIGKESGYGLYIIEQIADDVEYGELSDGRRYTRLRKLTVTK